ncbi:MAG: hypothetical protein ABFD83_01975 [Armatimonadota bacterium]
MESIHQFRQLYRVMGQVAIVVAIFNVAVTLFGLAVFFAAIRNGMALPGLILWVMVLWACLCIAMIIVCRRIRSYRVMLSDDCIIAGNTAVAWNQIQDVVHHPSKLWHIEFRIVTKGGKKLDIHPWIENVEQIESFVQSKLSGNEGGASSGGSFQHLSPST